MIVKLNKDDVDKMVELQNRNSFTDGWNRKMLIDAFNSGNYLCFGEIIKNKLVAFVGVTVSIDTCDIEDVLVDIDYRRQGLSKNLINHVLDELKTQNIQKVFLEVRERNIPAIELYEGLGFSKISIRKNYYFDGENALVYLKEL